MHSWEFKVLLPDGGGQITDTATGPSEFDARRAIYARYPGCKITACRRLD